MTIRTITQFRGAYAYLSCFHQSPITLHGIVYPSAEHAFHSEKTKDFAIKRRISMAPTSAAAKKIGRSIPLIAGWNEWRRYESMMCIQALKFAPNTTLAAWLLSTGDTVLIEGNGWHDTTWGICFCETCRGQGHNLLGWIIMRQRTILSNRRWQ